jgi:NAD(P)-dependent dehydrogenase (short-subunit alcohol dehydrogenase family)
MGGERDLDLGGRTAVVTGAGRNIGRAIALELAARGANLLINTRRNEAEALAVAAEARALGAEVRIVIGAAADPATVALLGQEAERAFGGADIVVSNAARRLRQTFFETSDEDWEAFLHQQLTASWRLAKAFAPGMIRKGWGRIIHIGGPDGYTGSWTRVPHAVGKGALRTLTRSLAEGLGPYGITVNDVVPGITETSRDPETHPQLLEEGAAGLGNLPIRRLPRPEDVAFACAFLCSERAGAITGTSIHVDGGRNRFG